MGIDANTEHIQPLSSEPQLTIAAIYQMFDNPKIHMISETYHHTFR